MSGYVSAAALETGWKTKPGPRVFSGHESFVCRYGWLPKLYEAITNDPLLFSSDENAIVQLGIGRNMVKSIRFWGESFGLIRTRRHNSEVTEFARKLLDPENGLDPYLETPSALWRLHWMATVHGGLGAWSVAFLESQNREVTRERFLESVYTRAVQLRGRITMGTITNHVDVFLRTYVDHSYSETTLEEALGSPFQELGLVSQTTSGGKPIVRLNRGPKHNLGTEALAFILHDFWRGTAAGSKTISLRSFMLFHASPGMVLLLDETSLYEMLDELCCRSKKLKLCSDGVGGNNLVGTDTPLRQLELIAWP